MPVPNLPEYADHLALPDEYHDTSDTFRFFGGGDGVFVLVKEGRPWFPNGREATIHPLVVTIAGDTERELSFPDMPYRIHVIPSPK